MEIGNTYASVHLILDVIEMLLARSDEGFIGEDDKYNLFVELVMAESVADSHRTLLKPGLGFDDPKGHSEVERRLNDVRRRIKQFADSLDGTERKAKLEEACRSVSGNFIR